MSDMQRILNLYKEGKIKETTIIKMASFKEEFLNYLNEEKDLEKTSGAKYINSFKEFLKTKRAKDILLGTLITPAIIGSTALIGKGMDTLERTGRDLNREKNYKKMLESRPELKSEDPLLIRKYWDSLIYFAPAIARDPLAAGAYIKQMLQYEEVGGPPYNTIKDLVQTQKDFKVSQPFAAETVGEFIGNAPFTLRLKEK